MVRTRIRNHRVGTLRPAWPARPAAAPLRRACVRAHSRSAADPSDPGLRPSAIGRSDHHEFACVAKAESVRNKTEPWLGLTRSVTVHVAARRRRRKPARRDRRVWRGVPPEIGGTGPTGVCPGGPALKPRTTHLLPETEEPQADAVAIVEFLNGRSRRDKP